jgi:hypothetical protein
VGLAVRGNALGLLGARGALDSLSATHNCAISLLNPLVADWYLVDW